jgi:hypothetical protein
MSSMYCIRPIFICNSLCELNYAYSEKKKIIYIFPFVIFFFFQFCDVDEMTITHKLT